MKKIEIFYLSNLGKVQDTENRKFSVSLRIGNF